MTTSSCKAKGRRLQQVVAKALLESAKDLDPNLIEEDVQSRSMGAPGTDIILSGRARAILGNLAIECKNVEALNVAGVFLPHYDKYEKTGATPILVHKRNHTRPLVTLTLEDFLRLNKGAFYVDSQ